VRARILIVEDDRIIADGLSRALAGEGYEVVVARDGEAALALANAQRPDLVLLDLMMPTMNGFEVTTELRRGGDAVPIIVVSARTDTRAKVRGLDLGADDFVAKPFDLDELLARVRRRLAGAAGGAPRASRFAAFVYEWGAQELRRADGAPLELSPTEHRLLQYFLRHPRHVATREQIIAAVWGDAYEGTDRTVDNFVMALRRKVGGDVITTVRGQGYRFAP
jgi:two-component system response regulator MprA